MKVWVWVVTDNYWDETEVLDVFGSVDALLKVYPTLEFDASSEASVPGLARGHAIYAKRHEVRC